jgi:hypothetical protein
LAHEQRELHRRQRWPPCASPGVDDVGELHEPGERGFALGLLDHDGHAPILPKNMEHPPIAPPREPVPSRPAVLIHTTQPLEPKAIARRHGHVGLHSHAAHARAALALKHGEIIGVDAVARAAT